MKRIPWDILIALLAGLGLGLVYSWVISPLRIFDSEPVALRADFKDQFRSVIAASYAATGNLPRAQIRLSLLKDDDPMEALNAQAQQAIASGQFAQADQLAVLAFALENGASPLTTSTPLVGNVEVPADNASTITPFPSPEDVPFIFTETPQQIETQFISETQTISGTATPRPTKTPLPTQGAPFVLIGQDTVCDINLPDGLLQVIVYNSSRRQLPGIKIIITWDAGEEQFFTGLKPELGNGYADYFMTPNVTYTIQLGLGSDIATNLLAPACQSPGGETYTGGFKLTFQQP